MAVSNAKGWIVLTTGNKSELATGYSTLYGDSAGGFAVIKDIPKTLVYRLCRYRNRVAGRAVIPEAVLSKAPSAELRPDQRDDDRACLRTRCSIRCSRHSWSTTHPSPTPCASGYDADTVARVAFLVDSAEYKRRQSPPGVRITAKAFGKDRRMPITNRYRDPAPSPVDAETGGAAHGGRVVADRFDATGDVARRRPTPMEPPKARTGAVARRPRSLRGRLRVGGAPALRGGGRLGAD